MREIIFIPFFKNTFFVSNDTSEIRKAKPNLYTRSQVSQEESVHFTALLKNSILCFMNKTLESFIGKILMLC